MGSGVDKIVNFKDFSRPNKEIKYFSRTLTEFKDFSRRLPKFKTFSRLYNIIINHDLVLGTDQVRFKSYLPSKKIYLSWTTGRDLFQALLSRG